jgi:hypothetical protein
MMPPQSPRPRWPTGWSLVKTIGCARVPIAISRPPRSTINVPTLPDSPMMRVPAWMFSVAPLRTNTAPRRT